MATKSNVETLSASAQSGRRGEDRLVVLRSRWPFKHQPQCSLFDSAGELQDSQGAATEYRLYCLFDGHRGAGPASLCAESVGSILAAQLPPLQQATGPTDEAGGSSAAPAAGEWEGALQEALLRTVVELQGRLGATGRKGGCSAVLLLQVGRLLTCASLGSARAVVYCAGGGEGLELSVAHKVGSNAEERQRLLQAGVQLAALDIGGNQPAPVPSRGVGCLRLWPGGLATSRALGDFRLSEAVLPLPHIRQALLPEGAACRVVLATDSVWRAGAPYHSAVRAVLLGVPLPRCPDKVISLISKDFGVQDDASVIVVDVEPPGGGGFLGQQAAADADNAACTKQGCSFLGLFRRSRPASNVSALPQPPPRVPPTLLADLDSANLMGLTSEPPPDAPPTWITLRLMSDIHRSLSRAREAWYAARRAHAAAATPLGPQQLPPGEPATSSGRPGGRGRGSAGGGSSESSREASPEPRGRSKEPAFLAGYEARAAQFTRHGRRSPTPERPARPAGRAERGRGGGYRSEEGEEEKRANAPRPRSPQLLQPVSAGPLLGHPQAERQLRAAAGAFPIRSTLSLPPHPITSRPPLSPASGYAPSPKRPLPPPPPRLTASRGQSHSPPKQPLTPRTPHLRVQRSASLGALPALAAREGLGSDAAGSHFKPGAHPTHRYDLHVHFRDEEGGQSLAGTPTDLKRQQLAAPSKKLLLQPASPRGAKDLPAPHGTHGNGGGGGGMEEGPAAEEMAAASAALQLFYRNAELRKGGHSGGGAGAGSRPGSGLGGGSSESSLTAGAIKPALKKSTSLAGDLQGAAAGEGRGAKMPKLVKSVSFGF